MTKIQQIPQDSFCCSRENCSWACSCNSLCPDNSQTSLTTKARRRAGPLYCFFFGSMPPLPPMSLRAARRLDVSPHPQLPPEPCGWVFTVTNNHSTASCRKQLSQGRCMLCPGSTGVRAYPWGSALRGSQPQRKAPRNLAGNPVFAGMLRAAMLWLGRPQPTASCHFEALYG